MSKTIQESIASLHEALREYIEATYHIGDPWLIEQRRQLLDEPGIIHQVPYLESTPRYTAGQLYADIAGLPLAARSVYELLSANSPEAKAILHNPPYSHQADAIKESLVHNRNLVVMTGTGSGKTESFLLPILGRLAREARERPNAFMQPAVRAFLLYPMNALVNDQLGRLRNLFGDQRLVELFVEWCGRPARFARYTSRTPYAGVRVADKDSRKLKSFDDFYVEIERAANGPKSPEKAAAIRIRQQLLSRGKWPAKDNLAAWFGEKGSHWRNTRTGDFQRAVMMPRDTELLTRHEVQENPPDLLVTNYSMLEYMLLRPIERPIFERTKEWLAANPNERAVVVLDEAHLYRGAPGAEVGLLLRRLRERLGIEASRMNIICATASFNDRDYAPDFGAQISGAPAESFVPIVGTHDLRPKASVGSEDDAKSLAAVDLQAFYDASDEPQQMAVLDELLTYLGADTKLPTEAALYSGLSGFAPLGLLVNTTMKEARAVSSLGTQVFPHSPPATANAALTAMLALGSRARIDPQSAGLIPCRVHTFFRGLPGLWVCMDPDCTVIPEAHRGGACGQMYPTAPGAL